MYYVESFYTNLKHFVWFWLLTVDISLFQEADAIIADISAKHSQQVASINQFLSEMTKFAEIQTQIDMARERIIDLGTSFGELEDEMVVLEDICNEMQQNNNKFEHEYQLRKYRERKHLELEQVKGRVGQTLLLILDHIQFTINRLGASVMPNMSHCQITHSTRFARYVGIIKPNPNPTATPNPNLNPNPLSGLVKLSTSL